MTHLTEEQFEDALAGSAQQAEHLAVCDRCREQLESMRAVRSRLQSAFASVAVPNGLAEKVRRATNPKPARRVIRLMRIVPLAAAACVLVVLGLLVYNDSQATAAQPELARIHHKHLSGAAHPGQGMLSSDDPAKLTAFLRSKLGSAPAIGNVGDDAKVTCCCVDLFRGRRVGSYILQTPGGMVSVVAVTDLVESLKLRRTMTRNGRTYKACRSEGCNIVAARQGDYTYCVVGEVGHEALLDVLEKVLAGTAGPKADAPLNSRATCPMHPGNPAGRWADCTSI